jgi:hypothetical protein
MDLRTARRQFFDRKIRYACSYDPQLGFDLDAAMVVPGGVRLTVGQRRRSGASTPIGSVFHVLDAFSVEGVDDRKHNCPLGDIADVRESILLRDDNGVADVEGRMSIETRDHAAIEVSYGGKLRFRAHANSVLATQETLRGGAWLALRFVTTDTRYHWLSENACVAFGTWTAEAVAGSATRNVVMNLDVYSAG